MHFKKNIITNLNISAKHPRFMTTALMKQENVMLLQQKKVNRIPKIVRY